MSGYMSLAFTGGAILALQIGINAALARGLANPIGAATVSFGIGTIALAVYFLITRQPYPTGESWSALPWWTLTGGALGAFYVVSTIISAPQIGAAMLVSLVIAGQILMSLILDHFGIAGFAQNPVTLWRVVGAALVIAGVIAIKQG